MRERLVARGLPAGAVRVVPNWPPAAVHPVPHEANPFRRAHGLEGRFVVMYSGNMGLAHPFTAVLDAAARLARDVPEAVVAFVGEGPRKAFLQADVRRRGLPNVRFLPFQPRARLAESLSAADLHLVTMEARLAGLVVPSKLYGVMAAGRPVLFLGPAGSEAARVVRLHDAGTVLPARPDGAALAAEVRAWHADPARRARAGARALAAVADARRRAADAFDAEMRNLLP
jgi:glycosyltransferase involved in cell wall biosynthesis